MEWLVYFSREQKIIPKGMCTHIIVNYSATFIQEFITETAEMK